MVTLSLPAPARKQAIAWAGVGLSCVACVFLALRAASQPKASAVPDAPREAEPPPPAGPPNVVRLTKAQQESIGLTVTPAEAGQSRSVIVAPGRVTPDEGHYAYITSRASGIVRSVNAQIGQDVKAGDLLATLDSPEVAQARFDLLTSNQELEVAATRADWQAAITAATLELIERLRAGDSPEMIQARFEGRAVGENREKLLTAESQLRVTRADMERKKGLLSTRAVSMAEYQVSVAEFEGALATYQSLLDRMGTESKLAETRTRQEKRQAETAIRVARGRLRALGVPPDQESIPDPPTEPTEPGQPLPLAMSLYELRAPFAGTILDREMLVPGVPIDTTHRIFLLANLGTVWVEASVHEGDFDLLASSHGGRVEIRSPAFPDRTFAGKVLYTGDLVDEKSRTIRLLAGAENKERLLKPGMFVEVEVHATSGRPAVSIPESALLTEGAITLVFVRTGPETFERRDVVVGSRGDGKIAILSGLKAGEEVVSQGAFSLRAEHIREAAGGA